MVAGTDTGIPPRRLDMAMVIQPRRLGMGGMAMVIQPRPRRMDMATPAMVIQPPRWRTKTRHLLLSADEWPTTGRRCTAVAWRCAAHTAFDRPRFIPHGRASIDP